MAVVTTVHMPYTVFMGAVLDGPDGVTLEEGKQCPACLGTVSAIGWSSGWHCCIKDIQHQKDELYPWLQNTDDVVVKHTWLRITMFVPIQISGEISAEKAERIQRLNEYVEAKNRELAQQKLEQESSIAAKPRLALPAQVIKYRGELPIVKDNTKNRELAREASVTGLWPMDEWTDSELTPTKEIKLTPEQAQQVEYPHTCPKCGEKCYIGLNKVEHRNKNTTCK